MSRRVAQQASLVIASRVRAPSSSRNSLRLLLCSAVLFLLLPHVANAEFLKISPYTYTLEGRAYVTVVPPSDNAAGVFVAFGPPSPIQLFDPAQLEKTEIVSLFIRFDRETNRFTKVLVGSHVYEIKGSFRIQLGALRITLDENNLTPYCSIVYEEEGKVPAILGLVGASEALNLTGDAVRLLEPSALNEQYKGLIADYELDLDYVLKLNGRPLTVDYIGLPVESKNPCLLQSTMVLGEASSKRLIAVAEEKGEISRAVYKKLRGDRAILKRLLVLRITAKSLIGLDTVSGAITRIDVNPKLSAMIRRQIVCTTSTVKIDE